MSLTTARPYVDQTSAHAVFSSAWISSTGRWTLHSNPYAGVVELRWYESHVGELRNHQGLWIGVFGERIVASGESFEEVHRQLDEARIADALIVRVPADVGVERYLIA